MSVDQTRIVRSHSVVAITRRLLWLSGMGALVLVSPLGFGGLINEVAGVLDVHRYGSCNQPIPEQRASLRTKNADQAPG